MEIELLRHLQMAAVYNIRIAPACRDICSGSTASPLQCSHCRWWSTSAICSGHLQWSLGMQVRYIYYIYAWMKMYEDHSNSIQTYQKWSLATADGGGAPPSAVTTLQCLYRVRAPLLFVGGSRQAGATRIIYVHMNGNGWKWYRIFV